MKTKKLFRVMSVLSTAVVLSCFSLSALAQDRSPADNKIEVVQLKDYDFKEMQAKYIQEQMTVKQDNTYVHNPYKYMKLDQIIKDKPNRSIANEGKDAVLVLDDVTKKEVAKTDPTEKEKEVEVVKKDITKLTEIEKKELNISEEDIDKAISELAKKANEDVKKKEDTKIEKEEVVVEQKKEEKEELIVEQSATELELQAELEQQSKLKKEDAEQLLIQAEKDEVKKEVIEDAVIEVEEEVAVLEDAVKDQEDTEEVKKIKAELAETKKILAEAKEALKESKAANTIIKSKSAKMEQAYCSQQSQISKLTTQMDDFQSNIYAPIKSQMDMMMQMMMMNQFASQGFQLDRGYSSFNSQNNFGLDYGMKMYGLSELFKTGSMGGMTNNYYNVGGDYYGGAYTNSTTHPMQQMQGGYMGPNMFGQQNPQMQFANPNLPYNYDLGGVNDTTNRSYFNQMNYQNMNRGPAQNFQGLPYLHNNGMMNNQMGTTQSAFNFM